MAISGTTKQWSIDHETFVARTLDGSRIPNSGATDTRKGDVIVLDCELLAECKFTGSPIQGAKSISLKLADMEKIVDEAHELGYAPAIALRIIAPGSPIADLKGMVDWVAIPINDFAWYLAKMDSL